jgi:hypothetical protein
MEKLAYEALVLSGGMTAAEKDAGIMDWVSNASEAVGLKPLNQSPLLNMVGATPEGADRATGVHRGAAVRSYGLGGTSDVLKKTGPATRGDFARPVMSAGIRKKLPGYNSGMNLGPITFKK